MRLRNRFLSISFCLTLLTVGSCAPAREEVTPAAVVETPVALEIYWTSWCSWCKKEMAELDQAYDYLIERGVTVVAIQVDSPDTGRIYNFQMVRGNLPRGIASVPYHRILVGTDLAYESLGYEAPNKLIKRALSVVNNE